MTIIAVANMKGGVGKTTTSVILAEMAAQRGMKSLLVDTDRNRSAFSKVMREEGEDGLVPIFSNLEAVHSRLKAPQPDMFKGKDVVVIDTPPNADPMLIADILKLSQIVVVPFLMGEDEVNGIVDLFEILQNAGRELYVFPIRLISPLESRYDRSLDEAAAEFFIQYGLSKKEIYKWPMRKKIKNNIGDRKPFHYGLSEDDRAAFKATFDVIFKKRGE